MIIPGSAVSRECDDWAVEMPGIGIDAWRSATSPKSGKVVWSCCYKCMTSPKSIYVEPGRFNAYGIVMTNPRLGLR